jgi:1,4-dihydroxy-2-naphthoyl-CoA synthase
MDKNQFIIKEMVMIKLKKIIKESKIELGKVYTDIDRPSFKSNEQIEEELLSEAQAEINTKRDLQRALKSAFNEIYKGKVPKQLFRGDTGEMLLTTETDGRGTRIEIVPSVIADAVRELK